MFFGFSDFNNMVTRLCTVFADANQKKEEKNQFASKMGILHFLFFILFLVKSRKCKRTNKSKIYEYVLYFSLC